MSTLKTQEVRDVIIIDDVEQFRITVVCIDKGPLDDTGIFLYTISDPRDPAQDLFARVVTIADLETYLSDRDAAMQAGQTMWRSENLTKYYTDLEVAVNATKTIFDRINAVVTEYENYKDNFATTSPETIEFPSAEASQVDELKAEYDTAYAAYQTALAGQVDAADARTAANDDLTSKTATAKEWSDYLASLDRLRAEMVAAKDALAAAKTGANAMLGSTDTFLATDWKVFNFGQIPASTSTT